jgi:hypothetical protein
MPYFGPEELFMTAKPFDASKYLTDLNGRDYLEVKWRLLWLRTEHPEALIDTQLVKHTTDLALFRAQVSVPGGGTATGWGSETAEDFGDYIEKAETKALGRALAALGYGTQFCEDFDFSAERERRTRRKPAPARRAPHEDGQRVVDTPVARRSLNLIRDGDSGATPSQLKAIYAIARDRDLDERSVEEKCRSALGCSPQELTKRRASEFIDLLRQDSRPKARAAQS